MLVVVAWVTVVGPAQPARFRDAVWAAALCVSNWQLIFQHVSYFARFESPLPLEHLWSLVVEEHHTSPGYKARSWLISRALAAAFPAGDDASPDCVIHVDPTPPRTARKPQSRPGCEAEGGCLALAQRTSGSVSAATSARSTGRPRASFMRIKSSRPATGI